VRELSSAALAFDSIADGFDERFSPWLSVASQRRAVRAALADAFPSGSRLIEIGGGTGEDALWLVERGREVLLTDASPAMVRVAEAKFGGQSGAKAKIAPVEELEALAAELQHRGEPSFDGAYSNFAGLNCVTDLAPFARSLARLLRPGAAALLVMFGTFCPGEIMVEGLRGRPRNMFRRFARGDVPARLSGREFTIRYHRAAAIRLAMAPWFELEGRQGIGVFVPPSAAEPWISRHPRFLSMLETLDRALSSPLAMFGDHILYRFVRADVDASGA
jgi:ubiquinone/menaquinone biosynthesis C-methylase UbiE